LGWGCTSVVEWFLPCTRSGLVFKALHYKGTLVWNWALILRLVLSLLYESPQHSVP
jgi:hypothetical protein